MVSVVKETNMSTMQTSDTQCPILSRLIDHSLDITEQHEGLRPQLANDPARKIYVHGDNSGYLLSFFSI